MSSMGGSSLLIDDVQSQSQVEEICSIDGSISAAEVARKSILGKHNQTSWIHEFALEDCSKGTKMLQCKFCRYVS